MLLRLAIPVLPLAFVIVHYLTFAPWITDDAYIYMRYAQNFLDGHGLVFNPGERVEGNTSILWSWLLVLGGRCGIDLVLLAQIYTWTFLAATLTLLFHAHRFVPSLEPRGSAVAALLAGTCGAFSPWAASGLETSLFAFEVTLMVLLYCRARRLWLDDPESPSRWMPFAWVGVIGGAAVMTRPEGAMVAFVLFVDALWQGFRRGRRLAPGIGVAAAFLLVFVPFFAWRWSYYGHILPNTFYVKVGATSAQWSTGLDYLQSFVMGRSFLDVDWRPWGPGLLLVLAAAIGWLLPSWRARRAEIRGVNLFVLLYAVYVVSVGGDHFSAFRFFAPIVPLLSLSAAYAVTQIPGTLGPTVVALGMAVFGGFATEKNPQVNESLRFDKLGVVGKAVGEWFRDHTDADAVIAVNAAGAIPYYSERQVIDMLGLNDEHIAHREVEGMGGGQPGHEKGDGAYVLERDPDYILFGSVLGSLQPQYLSDREMFAMPEFLERYEFREVPVQLDNGDTVKFIVWARKPR